MLCIEDAYSATFNINGLTYSIISILAYDETIDLAVLKINANNMISANICKQPTKTGDAVFAIGSSRGLTNTFSQGIITQANRTIDGVRYIQHDASITNGNSGGPLLNVYGEVIGINTWLVADSQNLNFAVFSGELDNLVYGTPMSLSDFYKLQHSGYKKLVDYIIANGRRDESDIVLSVYDDYDSSYTIHTTIEFSYNTKYDEVLLMSSIRLLGSDVEIVTGVFISKDSDSYFYCLDLYDDDGINTHTMTGNIQYETLNENTLIGYEYYEGEMSDKEDIREIASTCVIEIIDCLELVAIFYLDCTIADFGFIAF